MPGLGEGGEWWGGCGHGELVVCSERNMYYMRFRSMKGFLLGERYKYIEIKLDISEVNLVFFIRRTWALFSIRNLR